MTDGYYDPEKLPDDTPAQLEDLIAEARTRDIEADTLVSNGEFELKSTEPVDVVRYYLCTRRMEWADASYADASYDLTRFLEFCEYAGIDDLASLSSRDIEGFKDWRKRDENIALTTLDGQLSNIRCFIRKCERLEIIEEGLADSIDMPDLDYSDEVSYVRIEASDAQAILDYHQKHDYATRAHAEFALMWDTLCRLGDCRGLDLEDYGKDDEGQAYVEFVHRPETGTPIKNGKGDVEGAGGERKVNVSEWAAEIIDEYIKEKRETATDDYGRDPLFTTVGGRPVTSTVRRDIYKITQPCRYTQDCPVGRDPEQCEAKNDSDLLPRCPPNVSPHPVRRGGICHQLNNGVAKGTICERADVSMEVLNKHYDLRTKEEARVQRREKLEKHLDGYGTPDQTSTSNPEEERTLTARERLRECSPLVDDIASATDRYDGLVPSHSVSSRTMRGVAGYALFVLMTGINFGLLGIGFDPISMKLILNL